MAGPGDEVAAGAGGRGRLRASHADREQVVDMLKIAFVQGRLDRDEFGLRVGQALGSLTYAELAAITADLPVGQAAAHRSEPARVGREPPIPRPGRVIGVATTLYAGVWAVVILFPIPAVAVLTITSLLYYMIVVLIALGHKSASPHEGRSGGQPPPGQAPLAGGQASRQPPSANLPGQLPPTDHGRQYTAEAAHSRLPRPGTASAGRSMAGGLSTRNPAVALTR
jgi:Domain of unknown function (DUF1707)